jgi:hypothetical protein
LKKESQSSLTSVLAGAAVDCDRKPVIEEVMELAWGRESEFRVTELSGRAVVELRRVIWDAIRGFC